MAHKLTRDDRMKLVEARRALDELDTICKKGADCGFDMRVQDITAQELRKQIDAIERNFDPKRTE